MSEAVRVTVGMYTNIIYSYTLIWFGVSKGSKTICHSSHNSLHKQKGEKNGALDSLWRARPKKKSSEYRCGIQRRHSSVIDDTTMNEIAVSNRKKKKYEKKEGNITCTLEILKHRSLYQLYSSPQTCENKN